MAIGIPELDHILSVNSGVEDTYRHYEKLVTAGEPFADGGNLLKWYELHAKDQPVSDEVSELARNWLKANLRASNGLGFALLHRCGSDFYFLIICTWRHSNELWQTVFYKDGNAMQDFALFPRDNPHKPTLCVWELVPVWHEQNAWTRFLTSKRDVAAAEIWLSDCYVGVA